MSRLRQRPLAVGPLRAFEAVARRLGFSAAADELHLTQSAVSRQIQSLEEELGTALFTRGTRKVELTAAGHTLLRSALPWLERLDVAVQQIRQTRGRRHVAVATFASFASMWLLPRLQAFQKLHPDIDIRISAMDAIADLDDPDLDLALRFGLPRSAPPGAVRLFGEVITPMVGRSLGEQARSGQAPPLAGAADLSRHTLLEEDDVRPSAEYLSWRYWLGLHGQPSLEPLRWVYLNFTYQQIQAALSGQGVALARLPLVHESLERGELVEPFGEAGRVRVPPAYWLIGKPGTVLSPSPVSPGAAAAAPAADERPELTAFIAWVQAQAAETRRALGEAQSG